jgi:sigma-B regulation protein RsbU (phosphoserine phosphatase)
LTRSNPSLSSIALGRRGRRSIALRTRIVLLQLLASTALAAIVGIPLVALWNLSQAEFAAQLQKTQQEDWDNAVLSDSASLLALATRLLAIPQLHEHEQTGAAAVDPLLAGVLLEAGNSSLRLIAVIGPDGRLLRSSSDPGAADRMLYSLSLISSIKAGPTRVGLSLEENGRLALVAIAPLDGGRLLIIRRPDDLLARFARRPTTKLFLVSRSGSLIESTAAADWPLIREVGVRAGEIRTISRGGRQFTVIASEVEDLLGSPIATLIEVHRISAQRRRLVLINAGAVVVLFLGFAGLVLYGYMRSALAPLDGLRGVVENLAAGDVLVGARFDWRQRDDEIGAIGHAVEVFRQNAIRLQRLEIRAGLETAQQHALIRREMRGLAEMLAEPSRSEILADLERIETATSRGPGGREAAQAGQGIGLALAFQQMVARVIEQHRRLADLLAERTRDLLVVREALEDKAQLLRLREELNIARKLQQSSLPIRFPAFPDRCDFDIFAMMAPAREVGGDFYDFVLLHGDRLAVLIGDASGKGVSAALFIARARTLLRSSIGAGATPAAALAFANAALLADNPSAMFATAFAAIVELGARTLVYASAGHNPPYLLSRSAPPQPLDQSQGPALGLLEVPDYADTRVALRPRDLLFLCTDGVIEAVAESASFFGEDRLLEVLGRCAEQMPAQLVRAVQASLAEFVGQAEQADDITMLAFAYYGSEISAPAGTPSIAAINSQALG